MKSASIGRGAVCILDLTDELIEAVLAMSDRRDHCAQLGELPCDRSAGAAAGSGAELSRSGQFLRLLPRTVSQAICFFSCKVSRTSPTNE